MTAFSMPIVRCCKSPKCTKNATHTVFKNKGDVLVGEYCARHAEMKVRDLNAWKIEERPVQRGVTDTDGGL